VESKAKTPKSLKVKTLKWHVLFSDEDDGSGFRGLIRQKWKYNSRNCGIQDSYRT
jgi:hypothetical protein